MNAPLPRDLVALLEERAQVEPDRVGYRYLGQTAGPRELTYGELWDAATSIAARVRRVVSPRDRVLLLFPPGLEFIEAFLGCVVSGAIAVPAPPPNPLKPRRSLERLSSIVRSARPVCALTLKGVHAALVPELRGVPAFDDVGWQCIDDGGGVAADERHVHRPEPADIALIQYTSGSTSDPKGATLSHSNIAHNIAYFDDGWDHGRDSVAVNWLPSFHDLGLVYGILAPLWGGFLGIQMSPIDVITRPLSWLQAITEYRASHSCGPNFIYELCSRKVKDRDKASLDLSSWRMALTAAEPVRAETMQRFTESFAATGFQPRTFCPGYGLSEGTCKVVAVPCDEEPTVLSLAADQLEHHAVRLASGAGKARRVVGCGRPGRETRIEIVDPETRTIRDPGQVGEVWVTGPGVAGSYWDQPDTTEARLQARLQGRNGTPYLRTGDLGFLHEGQLFITGRIKDIIIIRGTNHYPQDIEYTVEDAHPSVRAGCSAAFSIDIDGEECLAIIAEIERRRKGAWKPDSDRRLVDPRPRLPPAPRPFEQDEVIAAITREVAEAHGLKVSRIALIQAGTIPKTTSGKIQRSACKQALLGGGLDLVADLAEEDTEDRDARRDELRAQVTEIVSEAGEVDADRLSPSVSLYSYGIDSLAGVNIAYEIGLLLGRDVPSEIVVEHDTIDKLVDYILEAGKSR